MGNLADVRDGRPVRIPFDFFVLFARFPRKRGAIDLIVTGYLTSVGTANRWA